MDLNSVVSGALNIGILVISIIFAGAVVIGSLWYLRNRKRWGQFEARIWGKDAFGQATETIDNAGIFVDPKTKNKRFFLKKSGVGLDPDNVPIIHQTGGMMGVKKIVYVRQTGLKNFQYIKPKIVDEEISIDVGEEDVNWAINEYDRQKKKFEHSTLLQYLPFISLGVVAIIILIIFIYFFKQFDVLKDLGVALKEASKNFANQNLIQ